MVALTLTILGASPAAPNTGGACSGYLLRQGNAAVLIDCGSGVAECCAQQARCSPWRCWAWQQLDGVAPVCGLALGPQQHFPPPATA